MRKLALVALLLLAPALALAEATYGGHRSSRQAPLDVLRVVMSESRTNLIIANRPWDFPMNQQPPSVARFIEPGAAAAQDTCDEACPNSALTPGGAVISTCVDAVFLTAATGLASDSTCATDVDAVAGIGMLCQCQEDKNHWDVTRDATQTDNYGCQPPGASYEGYGFVECWAQNDDGWIQGQYTASTVTGNTIVTDNPVLGFGRLDNLAATTTVMFDWVGGFTPSSVDNLSNQEWFIGLAVQDNTGSGLTDGATDYCGFRKRSHTDDSSDALYFVCARAGNTATGDMAEASNGTNIYKVDTGWDFPASPVGSSQAARRALHEVGIDDHVRLRFKITGTTVTAYVNDQVVPGTPVSGSGFLPNTSQFVSWYEERDVASNEPQAMWWYYFLVTSTDSSL